jgi:hypothetical protein
MKPDLEKFAAEHPDVSFIEYDVDRIDHRDGDDISVLPSFKLFRNKECLAAFAGANILKLKELVDSHTI